MWANGSSHRHRAGHRLLRSAAAVLVSFGAVTGALAAPTAAHATTTVNDYPDAGWAADQPDQWNFLSRECTSFAAWRINNDAHVSFTNQYGGVTWGNAANWANAARATGVPVDAVPTVGSVAVFPPGVSYAGPYGHVAWVTGVGNGTISVEDYNYVTQFGYGQHTVSTGGLSFIHFGRSGTQGGPETWTNPQTGKLMDLDHSNAADGTKIQLWTGDNTFAQVWIRTTWPGGYFKVSNRATGKCMDVAGPSTADGAAVHEWSCYATDSQLWSWVAKGTSYQGWPVYEIRNKYSGKCLDITRFGTTDGTPLQQWSCTNGWNQEWA